MSVYYDKSKKKYVARKFKDGSNTFIGAYVTEEDAKIAEARFTQSGERLLFEPEAKHHSSYKSTPQLRTYPSYEDLLAQHKNQAKVFTAKYMKI